MTMNEYFSDGNISFNEFKNKYIEWAKKIPYSEDGSMERFLNEDTYNSDNDIVLLKHTPIFDLVQKPKQENGLIPVGINAPEWVAVIATKGEKVATVSQLRYGTMKSYDEFPCGIVEDTDNTYTDAGLREFAEETGIKIVSGFENIKYLGKYATNPGIFNNYMHYVYIDLDKCDFKVDKQKLDEHEQIQFKWMPLSEIVQKIEKDESSALMAAAMYKFLRMKISPMFSSIS